MREVRRYGSFAGVYVLDLDETPGRGFIREADHLAELERVRVETLREAWAVVADRAGRSYEGLAWIGRQGTLAAIDRLINATTTGPCPGPGGGAHDRNHINSDGDPCCSKCGDNATTTGATDA